MANLVLQSTKILTENPEYVFINQDAVDRAAKQMAQEELKMPAWDWPVFIEGRDKETIDFFMLGDTINFAFRDFDTKQDFAVDYAGKEWKGAAAMWACLKRAYENWTPILNAEFLANISDEEMKRIFAGSIEIPMLHQRTGIFREVGWSLLERYNGHFYNLVRTAGDRLFNDGRGIVDRLVIDFDSFQDSALYKGQVVRFNKRAQLAAGTLVGRFRNEGLFQVSDADELTVFADYGVPKVLRHLGILEYEKSLAERVDSEQLIEAGSQEELEIRASTIHAAKMLQDRVNEYRATNTKKEKVNALHIDYRLWACSRDIKTPHHLTRTTAY